ncbi:MAG: hypothetical protein ACRCYU_02325 [Nocardioides sp.]
MATHNRKLYDNGCRCAICTEDNTRHVASRRARRLADGRLSHGRTGYDAGCRCTPCRDARIIAYIEHEGGYRRHLWRETVAETYRDTRDAWEALRESSTVVPAGAVAGTAGAPVSAYQLEDDDFRAVFPAPTLKAALIGLSAA